jgi:cytochrome b subunit of formate dehydrogenase
LKKSGRKLLRNLVHWVLVVYLIVYVVTGLGIIEWRTVEPLTFGMLGKALAQQIHDNMHIPFIILLVIHVYVSLIMKDSEKT